MANPVIEGTFSGRPFVNQYVDIVHEDLFIKIDPNFEFADVQVKYHINSSEDGVQIPFLFYASEYFNSFSVKIDGRAVQTKDIPFDLKISETTKFKDFAYFFEGKSSEHYRTALAENLGKNGFYIYSPDMLYFETDISKGTHLIEVSYKAKKWIDGLDEINKYSFRYALSPAKYWKSFGTLDVIIDASEFESPLSTNLGHPIEGNIDAIGKWHFDSLPEELVQIEYIPKVSPIAEFLLSIGAGRLACLTGLLLAIIHFIFLRRYRKRNPSQGLSLSLVIGALLIPFIFLMSIGYYDGFIELFIGQHASQKGGSAFMAIIVYPYFLVIYGAFFLIINTWMKTKYARQTVLKKIT